MKIVALSDLHGTLPEIEPCDMCIIAGDIFPLAHDRDMELCFNWANGYLKPWLASIPSEITIATPGNHDFYIEKNTLHMREEDFRWRLLIGERYEWKGWNIYGMPWVPYLSGWAYHMNAADEASIVDRIPNNTDILVTHSPAYGVGDNVGFFGVGSMELRDKITQYLFDLKLHVFGHIHEDAGRHGLPARNTQFYNVTIKDAYYDHVYSPTVIEL